jgi:hypothetical protein
VGVDTGTGVPPISINLAYICVKRMQSIRKVTFIIYTKKTFVVENLVSP